MIEVNEVDFILQEIPEGELMALFLQILESKYSVIRSAQENPLEYNGML